MIVLWLAEADSLFLGALHALLLSVIDFLSLNDEFDLFEMLSSRFVFSLLGVGDEVLALISLFWPCILDITN